MEYYSALNRNILLILTTYVNFRRILLSETSYLKNDIQYNCFSGKGRIAESKSVASGG